MTTLPHSESTEASLIARLLVDPSPIPTLRLTPDDFFVGLYGEAYAAMLSLVKQGRPVDLVTLRDEGVELGDVLDSVGPAHRAPVSEYAALVRRDAIRRHFVTRLSSLVKRANTETDPQVLVSALQDDTAALADEAGPSDTLGRVNLSDYQQEPDPPLLGVLAPQGTTILYGDGGDGKGWVAAKLASQLGVKVAILDFETQPQEWGVRLDRFGKSLNDVLYFAPPMTMDRWATAETARVLKSEGVGFLIVDSAMYASDVDDPYSPNGALAYGRARRRLGNLPALLLAHTTGGMDKVFGSVFWRNESRIVWRLNKDTLTRQRYLECRKANGYPDLEGTRLNIEFDAHEGVLNLHANGQPWGEGVPA